MSNSTSLTIDELVELYRRDEVDAKRKLVECFSYAFDAFSSDSSTNKNPPEFLEHQPLMDDILRSLAEWSPRQNLLLLYLRWAKRLPKNHQTDSLAVVQCIISRFKDAFKNGTLEDVLTSRNLSYKARSQNTDHGCF